MFKVTNTDKVFDEIDAWLAAVERETLLIAINMMWVMLGKATLVSPQYSGDFVANFQFSIGTPSRRFTEGIFPGKAFPSDSPFQRGDTPAVQYALDSNTGRFNGAKLGQTLWLSNSALHHDLYAWKIEDGLLKLRPVNYGGHGPLRQVKNHIRVHYSRITKDHKELLK
jgi:hypothetical protein